MRPVVLLLLLPLLSQAFLWPDCIDVWRSCQSDRICRFLYREGRERAICRAIDYFRAIEARNQTPPIWPAQWLPADPSHASLALVSSWNMDQKKYSTMGPRITTVKDFQLIHNERDPVLPP